MCCGILPFLFELGVAEGADERVGYHALRHGLIHWRRHDEVFGEDAGFTAAELGDCGPCFGGKVAEGDGVVGAAWEVDLWVLVVVTETRGRGARLQ